MQPISSVERINHPIFKKYGLNVQIKRDDLIDSVISGNKSRKLKYNLAHAKSINAKGVLTFGGSFSNHIHACAFACKKAQLPSIGIIRGEQENQHNYTLRWAQHWGMQLSFVDRKTYRERHNTDYLNTLMQQYPDHLIVPEGGTNALALKGMSEVIDELSLQAEFDTIMVPVGSGGTIAGLILGDKNQHEILGVAVLKQGQYLNNVVTDLLPEHAKKFSNWQILTQYHGGGYAKFSPSDSEKIRSFNKITGVNFEPIYSGKMIIALLDLIEKGYFPPNHRIVLLHTGGLQGLAGMFSRGILNEHDWPLLPVPLVR